MDTPTIAKYYREKDPMERLKLLEQSIAAGEEPEENRIRKELWEIRYSDKAETGDTRVRLTGEVVARQEKKEEMRGRLISS